MAQVPALADVERRGKEQHDALRARVEALAEEWDTNADARYSSARIAKSTAARALRAALDQNGGQER